MWNSKHLYSVNLLLLATFIFCFCGMSCISKTGKRITEPPVHSHYYPFTEVLGKYHLRLIADHREGNMALVFEDFNERPVKPVKFKHIKGKITFPDNTTREQTFSADTKICSRYCRRYYSRKYGFPKQRGVFSADAEWLKTTPKFTLEADVNLKGKDYHVIFQYEVPGGAIPYHRK